MNAQRKIQFFLGLALLIVLIGAQASPARAQSTGTTLNLTASVTSLWKQFFYYGWTINKTVSPSTIEIASGQSGPLGYTLTVTRYISSQVTHFGLNGTLCVTNTGSEATQNGHFVDRIQYRLPGGEWQDIPATLTTLYPSRELNPGETGCKSISLRFDPFDGAEYRNVADFIITNYVGYVGQEHGVSVESPFSLPVAPRIIEYGATASVSDAFTCPAGFTCTASDSGPWNLTDSAVINYTITVHNDTAACDSNFTLDNIATLTYTPYATPKSFYASASTNIYTGPCTILSQGCTPGYWKNHPESWKGYSPTQRVDSVFSVPASVVDLADDSLKDALSYPGGPGLYGAARNLLRAATAALLNAAHDGVAYPRTEAAIIADVNAALASGNRGVMLALAAQLDADNNLGCPLH